MNDVVNPVNKKIQSLLTDSLSLGPAGERCLGILPSRGPESFEGRFPAGMLVILCTVLPIQAIEAFYSFSVVIGVL